MNEEVDNQVVKKNSYFLGNNVYKLKDGGIRRGKWGPRTRWNVNQVSGDEIEFRWIHSIVQVLHAAIVRITFPFPALDRVAAIQLHPNCSLQHRDGASPLEDLFFQTEVLEHVIR